MTYKTVLVHAEAAAVAGPRLECATAIARDFDALLIGVGARAMKTLGVSDPYGYAQGPWLAGLQEQVESDLRAAEAAFLKSVGSHRHEWRVVQDFPASAMAHTARVADLIVAGGSPNVSPDVYHSADVGELVVTASRPVIVAPPGAPGLQGRSVIVAWKDTREARRAVADALPFLQRADHVLVLEVCAESDAGSAEVQTSDVAQALGRHGVTATAKVVVGFDATVCERIETEASARGADLIVAGGYGRSRFAEWVLGGVTRGLLREPKRFLLLSH